MGTIFCPIEEETGKRIKLKKGRKLYYKRFTRDDEKDGTKEDIIQKSIGYVILDELKKENTTQKKKTELQEKVENELRFFDENYVIYKKEVYEETEPEWKTDYLKRDENDFYKLNESRIKGYIVVQNECSEENAPCLTTVLLVSKKKVFPFLLFFFLLLLAALCVKAFYNPEHVEVPTAESSTIEFAEDATEYDDTPVLLGGLIQDIDNSDIKFNLLNDAELNTGDKIPFANYSVNIDNLEFYVTYAGETDVIYNTGVIKPGTQVEWEVSDTLDSGAYTFDIYMVVYPYDGSTPSISRCQVNLHIQLH